MKASNYNLMKSGVLALLTVIMVVAIGSCGRSSSTTITSSGQGVVESTGPKLPFVFATGRKEIPSLNALLSELDSLQQPENADPEVWDSLKEEMRGWLVATFGDGKGMSKYPYRKPGEDPGLPTHDYVKPRDFGWVSSGEYGKLVWTYVNDGDYNQDSCVTICDVTPVAEHWLHQVGHDPRDEFIDEDDEPGQPPDGDGIVDDGDLDTLYKNWWVDVKEYQVLRSTDAENWDVAATVQFADRIENEEGGRDSFEFVLSTSDYRYYKARPLSNDGLPWHYDEGLTRVVESDVLDLAPHIQGVSPSPIKGRLNDVIGMIYANVKGAGPFTYSWNFAGHLSPNTSHEPVVYGATVVEGEPGVYTDATLTVSNAYGEDVWNITIEVVTTAVPPEIVRIWMERNGEEITEGDPGWEVTFKAEVTGSTPMTYSWNFGGGATPNTSSDASPVVTLGDFGTYDGTLSVTNAGGSDQKGFQYAVGRKPVIGDITPATEGYSGDVKTFSVTFTGTPPINYTWDFGGGAEPNVFSGQAGDGETVQAEVTLQSGLPYDLYIQAINDQFPDNEARTYTLAYITATNPAGTTTEYFDLEVAGKWHIEEVDTGTITRQLAMAFDSAWEPGISYWRQPGLMFAKRSAGTWTIESVEQPEVGSISIGSHNDLRFDHFDKPNVSYSWWNGGVHKYDLKFAVKDGEDWLLELVDDGGLTDNDVGSHNSLVLYPDGRPAIAYLDDSEDSLKFAEKDMLGAWQLETIVGGETPGYSDVAVQGYTSTQLKNMAEPVISFSTFSSLPVMARVELIERSQGDWGTPDIVDTLGGPGLFMDTSLALDSNQVPKLAYYRDVYSRDLRFAELVGQDWNAITVDDGGGDELVGQYASLALDQSERPLIGYHHYNNGTHVSKLKIAYRADGSCWYIEELPVGTGSVGDVSLKLFSDWNPAVAFEQAEPYAGWHLWYARYW